MANAKLSTSAALTLDQQSQFAAKLEAFRQGVQKLYDEYWTCNNFTHNPGSVATVVDGQRYTRVFLVEKEWVDYRDHSKGEKPITDLSRKQIHSFIDKLTGDVLKPATYKAPAKHARGNIFDVDNGLRTCNHFGPGYLK